MAKIVYPTEVFDKEENGVMYYKDGVVNDEIQDAGPGIFQSWRYSFDAGKQVFRAKNSGKIFEKRLVKDSYGNPKWTAWLEVPDGGDRGVQAVVINEGAAMLPNTDGVIRINVDPKSIGTFNRQEIYELINSLIAENDLKKYIFVPWPTDPQTGEYLTTYDAAGVIAEKFPDGGESGMLYIVAACPGISPNVTQFIWDYGPDGLPTWIDIGTAGEIGNLVNSAEFTKHVNNNDFDIKHLTSAQVTKLNDLVPRIKYDEDIDSKLNSTLFEDHVSNDIVHITDVERGIWMSETPRIAQIAPHYNVNTGIADPVAHITQAERDDWNSKVATMPSDHWDYVARNGNWDKANIQKSEKNNVTGEETIFHHSAPLLVELVDGQMQIVNDWPIRWNWFEARAYEITNIRVHISGAYTRGSNMNFKFVASEGGQIWRTEPYNSNNPDFGLNPAHVFNLEPNSLGTYVKRFKELYVEFDQGTFAAKPEIYGLSVVVTYKKPNRVNVGDHRWSKVETGASDAPQISELLELNLITNNRILVNGEPFSSYVENAVAYKHAEWGWIEGDIAMQSDLTSLVRTATERKLDASPVGTNLRYDSINGLGWIPSLVQHVGSGFETIKIWPFDDNLPSFDVGIVNNGKVVQGNLLSRFNTHEILGKVLTNIKIIFRQGVAIDAASGGIYFTVDNDKVLSSPSIKVGQNTLDGWTWEIGPCKFNELKVWSATGKPEALIHGDELRIEAEYAYYSNVTVSEANKGTKVRGTDVEVVAGTNAKVTSPNGTVETTASAAIDVTDPINPVDIAGVKVTGTAITLDGSVFVGSTALNDYFFETVVEDAGDPDTQPWAPPVNW